jgi:hypothetical protein
LIQCSSVVLFKKKKKKELRILEWLVCLSSFYFLTGCLYADADVAELFVLLLLPQPFDAARIATAAKGRGKKSSHGKAGTYGKVLFLSVMETTKLKGRKGL